MSPRSNDISLNEIKDKIIITNSKKYNIQNRIGTSIIYNITSFKELIDVTLTSKTNIRKILLNSIDYSNKIILSAEINISTLFITNLSLLSQHNILNNIVYYNKDNSIDNPNPRIIFKKSYARNIINNNKLLDISNSKININILKTQFLIDTYQETNLLKYFMMKNINIILNYYNNYNNTNYYQINLKDFYFRKNSSNQITSINLHDFSFNKLNKNFVLNNNYNINDSTLETIFCISNNIVSKLSPFTNISDTSHNLLLFNIPEHKISFKLKYYNQLQQISKDNSNSNINFIIKKFNNFKNSDNGKIYITKDIICLNTQVYTQNKPYNQTSDNSNHILLSNNNGSTGLTINHILKHMIFDISKQIINNTKNAFLNIKINENNINKIYIIKNKDNYNYNTENLNYLINNDYNFSYNHINYYKSLKTTLKEETIDFSNIIKTSYENIYRSRINDLSLITNYSHTFANNNNLISNIGFNKYYNFRNKYGTNFDVSDSYILKYNYNNVLRSTDISYENIENMIDFSENLLLNFININLDTFISTYSVPNDFFKNVDCLFTYNKPGTNNYEYPNNNIDICNNPPIDVLVKAIELLPNSNQNTSNTTFIPFRNSSNMSKKQIYGHIANNNIPKLLSIEPYDKRILIGRGLEGQYNIDQECPNEENIVLNKYNSQLHSSFKLQNNNTKNINYANIIKRNKRGNVNNTTCDDISYIRNNVTSKNYKTYISRFHLKK